MIIFASVNVVLFTTQSSRSVSRKECRLLIQSMVTLVAAALAVEPFFFLVTLTT